MSALGDAHHNSQHLANLVIGSLLAGANIDKGEKGLGAAKGAGKSRELSIGFNDPTFEESLRQARQVEGDLHNDTPVLNIGLWVNGSNVALNVCM
jgi:hypothetical protein